MSWGQNEMNREELLRTRFLNEMILRHRASPIAPESLTGEKLAGIRHLHIIGTEELYAVNLFPFMGRCYTDPGGELLLLFQIAPAQLGRIVAACAPGLEKLEIGFTNWQNVDLQPFGRLRSLELSAMHRLRQLTGLERCSGLETLSLRDAPLADRLDVSDLANLRTLKLRNTGRNGIRGIQNLHCLEHMELKQVRMTGALDLSGNQALRSVALHDLDLEGICLDEPLGRLENLDIARVPLADADFLGKLPNLKKLTLSDTKITVLPDLSDHTGLEILDLNRSPVRQIGGLPARLAEVRLGETGLTQIPGFFREMKQLRWLDLSRLQLEALPAWLPEVNPVVTVEEFCRENSGIWLYGTTVPGVDLTALMLPRSASQRELTQQKTWLWFASREREEPSAAAQYRKDPGALEFVMEFAALPDGLLERLWMRRWAEADRECTWAEGTRLVHGQTGVSAVICRTGNTLECFVRPSERSTQLHDYLSSIKADVDAISQTMKLQCLDCRINHKSADQKIPFSYDDLMRRHRNGERQIPCGLMLYAPFIEDILNQNHQPVDQDRDKLLEDLADIFATMQNDDIYLNLKEDKYTTRVRDDLNRSGYIARDQTLGGLSQTESSEGRVDMSISKVGKTSKAWTLYEAVILKGKGPSELKNWDEHLGRVMDNYNLKGLPFVLLASYVKCSMVQFRAWFRVYLAHLSSYAPPDYCLCSAEEMNLDVAGYAQNEFVRVARCTYRRLNCDGEQDGFVRTVYHFFVRFGV